MSHRGRDSDPQGNDADGEDAAPESTVEDVTAAAASTRPIAPYDPYRRPSGETPRQSTRNVAAESFSVRDRRESGGSRDTVFLPDDDPLNADAWQLEIDEIATGGDDELVPTFDPGVPPPSRRPRRQPSPRRERREPTPGATRSRGGRSAATTARTVRPRTAMSIGVPQAVAGSSLVADQTALALLGIDLVSIVLMTILMGVRVGGLPSPIVLQLDAAGNPALWGAPGVLWRLPLMSVFITLMFLVVAWFLHPIDRFAARFALGSAVVAQLVAWVALIQHLG